VSVNAPLASTRVKGRANEKARIGFLMVARPEWQGTVVDLT
jgi:hypothetical protein